MANGNNSNRKVGLKWLFVAVGIVLAAGIAAWLWQSSECVRISSQCDREMRDFAKQSAQTVARAVATFGNRQITAGNWEALQDYADDLVKAKAVAYVTILDMDGVAVIHTNRSFKGSKLEEAKDTENVVHASVPVMNLTDQVATARVGINVNQR